jgi:putative ABC transport system permease protein
VVSMLSTSDSAVRLVMQADLRLLAFLAAVGGLVTAIFGLAPALRASRISPNEALKAGAARQSARTGFFRPLVAAQTAFGFVVLFVAGLCLASFSKLARIDVGFDARDVLVATIAAGGATPGEMPPAASWQQLLDRVSRIPGVESAGLSGWGLFESSGRNKAVRVEGRPVDSDDPWYLPVSPGFLATMRIPLVEGRDFDWRDARADRPTAVIVNQSFARRYFPHGSPVGRRFFRVDGGSTLTPQDVIGVARDAKYNDLRSAAPPTVYDVYRSEDGAALQLRTRLDAGTLAATLREEVARVHPAFALTALTRQATLIGNSMVRERALAVLAAFFSTVAMVLVMVGLYGVLSYGVAQRAREIGIRLALGAQPAGVVGLVVSDVGAMAAAGLAIGAIGAIAAARYVQPLLYEVRAADVPSTAWPLAALLGACLLSALVPAWRATRVDPVTTLRAD